MQHRNRPIFLRDEDEDDSDDNNNRGGGRGRMQEGLSGRDIDLSYARRQAHFADSTRSDAAQQGSRKEKDYHERLQVDIMRQR